jgi:outer membrane protein assembly factor BamB
LALIELDLTAQPDDQRDHPPAPAYRYRTTGLVLAAVLVLVLGGAAAPEALRWQYLGAVPSALIPESPFQLDGDRVYTAGGLGNARTVSAWTLAKPPVKLWSVPFPAREIGPDQVAYGDVRAQRAGDVVLITDGPATTAVDARTGATRWHTDIGVRPLDGDRIGLVQDPQFRPHTVYNQDGGAPGEIFFSASGVPHDEPPIETDLRGVDLRTGATVWSATATGSVEVFDSGGVLVLGSGRLTLRSAETGAVLRTTELPPLGGQDPDSGQLAGDVMLISYGSGDSAHRALVGYSVRTFRPLWQVPEARLLQTPGSCSGLACADEASGSAVLDPATGRALWHAPAGLNLLLAGDFRGGNVQETDTDGVPVRIVDPVTGDERLSLKGWQFDVSGDDPLLVQRAEAPHGSLFAVVDEDPVALKPLGTSHGPVSDCASDDRFVVCRGTGELQVFAYRN